MATAYRKTTRPTIANWTAGDHARFDSILNGLKTESFPNGNCGCQDRQHQRFLDAGFVITKQDHGDSFSIAWAYFDLAKPEPEEPEVIWSNNGSWPADMDGWNGY